MSPLKSPKENSQTYVLEALKKNDPIDLEYWKLTDDTIDFFRTLEQNSQYKSVITRPDGPEFQTCIDAAKFNEVTTTTFPYAVLMVNLYSKMKPKLSKAPKLNPNETVAKLIEPGEYLGTINKTERFFVKLVFVGKEEATKGTLFKVVDRMGNVAFFLDRAEKFKGKFHLTDCFAIHATPSRHTPDEKSGEKHTVFRNVEFIAGTVVPGKGTPDKSDDESIGKIFTKGGF